MGFGRSGTSLMGGILYQAGYYMGEGLYPPRHSNPKGFFENAFINGINERILANYDYSSLHDQIPVFDKTYSPYNPGTGQRWLTYIPKETDIKLLDEISENEIKQATARNGYAYKDPRFNYTLGLWNKYVDADAIYICVFRKPDIVVESVMTECKTTEYLSNFYINRNIAFKLWYSSYANLLYNQNQIVLNRVSFIHYEQLLSGDALLKLSNLLGVKIDSNFVDPKLNRSKPSSKIPMDVQKLYGKLCKLADYKND